MIDLTDELTQEYFAECREHLITLETDLLTMEKGGADIDEEPINRAFRAVHSVKGGAAFFDLTKIPELAHQMEDILSLIRSGKMIPTSERIRILLSATDRLHELILSPA
jgi:two-component system, chemotaxis family, sensor kinase CheA